jgi:nucleoid-associated protein EbfC
MKDLMGLIKQAQQMQERMQNVQAELDLVEVEGQSGAGAVKIVMTAKGQFKSVTIEPSLLVPEEKEIVEDLILAAANDAKGKAEQAMQERMAEITKGLPLPPGMKLF